MTEQAATPITENLTNNDFEGRRLRRVQRLGGDGRRAQLIRIATSLFARAGLNGTTTLALARAAGITEPVLYAHFRSKDGLFRVAVENNIDARLRALDTRLGLLKSPRGLPELIESLAKETVSVCVSPSTNAMLTNWALLEAPEYAADLYRNEIGAVELMWEREVRRVVHPSSPALRLLLPFIPQAVNVCLAYGFWLSALRHTPATAKELACQFARALSHMPFSDPGQARHHV